MNHSLDRRDFMKMVGAGTSVAEVSGKVNARQSTDKNTVNRPNIVFMMSDQQRFDTLGCLGYPYAITPNLDKLAMRGACFSHNYVQGTVCAPSRASLMTGKYVHEHGVHGNMRWIVPFSTEPNWVEEMKNGGYHTANIGKLHTRPTKLKFGFDYRFVVENKNHNIITGYDPDDYDDILVARNLKRPGYWYFKTMKDYHQRLNAVIWPLEDELYQDNFVGRLSVNYIRNYDFKEKPLFLWVGFSGPHDPYDITTSALERYPDVPIPEPFRFPGELDTKPPEQRRSMEVMEGQNTCAAVWWSCATPDNIRRLRKHYYANVMVIDEWVGKIVDAIQEQGQLDNTLFVYSSDHGDALGDHDIIYKFASHYDSVVRVPLVLSGYGVKSQGILDPLIEQIDLGPTILETAHVNPKKRSGGVSMMPLLKGEKKELHTAVFSELGYRIMVRNYEWKLIFNAGKSYGELYNMQEDPHELKNLYDSDSHKEIRNKLTEQILDWYGSHRFEANPEWSSGKEF